MTVSYAQTLDGRLATSTGSSRWISGNEALSFAHQLRASHDAVMVGVGTVFRDNPRLTVRLTSGDDPLRVVVDSTLRTPFSSAVLADGAAASTVLAVTARAPKERLLAAQALGATVLVLPSDSEAHVDLCALLGALHERGVASLMVEGGARLITGLLQARLVDRLVVAIAPKILGDGIEAIGDLGIRELDSALSICSVRLVRHGADVVLDGRVSYPVVRQAHHERRSTDSPRAGRDNAADGC